MTKRRTTLVVLTGVTCMVVIGGFFAIRWALRAYQQLLPALHLAAGIVSETSEPPPPRPMFHELGPSDHGDQWNLVPFYQDSAGVWMQMDVRLNIVVVFAARHRVSGEWGPTDAEHEYAVFRRGTPYEATVQNTPDMLVWVDAAGQARLAMESGVADRIEQTLLNDPHASADLLRTLVGCYEGSDKSRLETLVDGYRNTATSRAGKE